MMAQQYKHFKGSKYTLWNIAYCKSENEFYVVYSLTDIVCERPWGWCIHCESKKIYCIDQHRSWIDSDPLTVVAESSHPSILLEAQLSGLWIQPVEQFFGCIHVTGGTIKQFEKLS